MFSSVHLLSGVRLFVTPWTTACQTSLSITNSWSLLKLGDAIQPSHSLLSPSPPTFNLSQLFSNESVLCIRWPEYWSFSFSTSPSSEYSGLSSFRMDWWDLRAAQGTLKSLLQHHFKSINSSLLSLLDGPTLTSVHDYWKNHMALGIWTFLSKLMSLLFDKLLVLL